MASNKREKIITEFSPATYDEWKDSAIKALKGVPFDKSMFNTTYEGITLNPIYNQEDVDKLENFDESFPGFSPYSRSTNSTGLRLNEWQILQETPYPMPTDFNVSLKKDLKCGQTAIKISIDRATAIHDDFISDDLSGTDLFVSHISDLERALDGIDLNKYPVYFDAGIGNSASASIFVAYCKKMNYDLTKIHGGFEFDPIGALALEGNLPAKISNYYDDMAEFLKWSTKTLPNFKVININTSIYHNGGSNSVQELSYGIAIAVEYIREMLKRGLDINLVASSIRFTMAIGINFFMEIAKFRAARVVWAKIIKEFGGNEDSQKLFIHAMTSNKENSKLDPYVNVLRSTTQSFSAIIGGCDSLQVGFFDAAFGLPDDFSRRVSRNTQNVLKHESHLTDTIDPAGGSYYIEVLTYELARQSWENFQSIESNNGFLKSFIDGTIQKEITENFKKRICNLSLRKDVIVGTNKYTNIHEKAVDSIKVDFGAIDTYINEFEEYLDDRLNLEIDFMLDELENKMQQSIFDFDLAVKAALEGATSGEIFHTMNLIDDEGVNAEPVLAVYSSDIFEELRDMALLYKDENGSFPNISQFCFGAVRDWKARSEFSSDFYLVGGFESTIYESLQSVDEAIEKFNINKPKMITICSTDEMYNEIVPNFATKIKSISPDTTIILAGYPKDKIEEFKSAGIDIFIHVKANVYETMVDLQKLAGARN